jgi:Spy/CpxP family protein refolding chaperone
MYLLKKLPLTLSALILLAIGSTAWAQDQQGQNKAQTPEANRPQRPFDRGEGRGFRRGPGPGGSFGPGLLRELNLTDDQKQQVRNVIQQGMASTKAQREELRQLGEKRFQGTLSADDEARAKTLHEQMRAAMQDNESKIAAILTAEQKAKLADLIKERQANGERFGKRRGGFPRRPGEGGPPPQKPANPPQQP